MSIDFKKKYIIFSVIGMVVVMSILASGYYIFLKPIKNEISLVENQLATEKQLYETLANKVVQTNNDAIENTIHLQKKLPVEPFVEQFLLDLEKAEVVSNSFIQQMNFSNSEIDLNGISTSSAVSQQEEDAINEDATQTNNAPAIPDEMKRIMVSLSVQSPNYFDMLSFLNTIENLERITKIDSLSFSSAEEIKSVDQEMEDLSYSVVVSTFYYPKLEELKKELPPFEAPPPSNKKNPLVTGMYLKEDD